MAAAYGYTYVSETAFLGFRQDLEQGLWADIDIAPLRGNEPKAKTLLGVPLTVSWKVGLLWALEELGEAMGLADADRLAQLDLAWDTAQRRLDLRVAFDEQSEKPQESAAAKRVRSVLLTAGLGTAQTNFAYDQEVDFGRQQGLLASKEPTKSDIHTLGLDGLLGDIRKRTEALAEGLGRNASGDKSQPRSNRVRAALLSCRQAFNRVHDSIEWCASHTSNAAELKQLEALRAPLDALLARNPPSTTEPAPAAPATPATPVGGV